MKWRPCSVKDCSRRMRLRGLCEAHYNRLKKSGDVQAGVPILAMDSRRAKSALRQILYGRKKLGA